MVIMLSERRQIASILYDFIYINSSKSVLPMNGSGGWEGPGGTRRGRMARFPKGT